MASPGFDDNDPEKSISIYDVDTDCNGRGGDRSIFTSIEWKAGLSKNLMLDFGGGDNQTATFVTGPGQNVVSNWGPRPSPRDAARSGPRANASGS